MAPTAHSRSLCSSCGTELVHLAGDPSVSYEEISPIDGSPDTLVEHTEQRCQFHQFLTPTPGRHTLPGNASWPDHTVLNTPSGARWIRTDDELN